MALKIVVPFRRKAEESRGLAIVHDRHEHNFHRFTVRLQAQPPCLIGRQLLLRTQMPDKG